MVSKADKTDQIALFYVTPYQIVAAAFFYSLLFYVDVPRSALLRVPLQVVAVAADHASGTTDCGNS